MPPPTMAKLAETATGARVNRRIEQLSAENIIIGGDFNFVADYQRDSNYLHQNNPRASEVFSKIIDTYKLVDCWIAMKPNTNGFTWMRQNPLKYGRLDRLYVEEHLISHVTTVNIHSGYRSDHNMVYLWLREPQKKRGPGIWKFNE